MMQFIIVKYLISALDVLAIKLNIKKKNCDFTFYLFERNSTHGDPPD